MTVKALQIKNFPTHYRFLKALPIIPKDDTFHGNINLLDIEWWYFDAVFDNGYSVHIGIRTYHIRRFGIVQSRINVYKDGEVAIEVMKTNLLRDCYILNDRPCIQIENKTVVNFDYNYYVKTGNWKYKITMTIDTHAVDLIFIGTSEGWKIETSETCWTVPLPKAVVTGTITVNSKKIPVNGVGYHDHNWNYSPVTAMNNLGWFWGRITGNTLNITWAKTMQSAKKGDLIAIINQDNKNENNKKDFYSISPKTIDFRFSDFIKNHRKWIPSEFKLFINNSISNSTISIKTDIHLKTLFVQHTKIFTIHYWRYHVITNGTISLASKTEKLKDKPQIIEFLSFK
jgi:hypothetical protein